MQARRENANLKASLSMNITPHHTSPLPEVEVYTQLQTLLYAFPPHMHLILYRRRIWVQPDNQTELDLECEGLCEKWHEEQIVG